MNESRFPELVGQETGSSIFSESQVNRKSVFSEQLHRLTSVGSQLSRLAPSRRVLAESLSLRKLRSIRQHNYGLAVWTLAAGSGIAMCIA